MIALNIAVYALLSGTTASLVSNRLYPLEAPASTSTPFLVYERNSVVQYSRDGVSRYDSTIIIFD